MPGSRRLIIIPALIGILVGCLGLQVAATNVRAETPPVVSQAVGGYCGYGSVWTVYGCTNTAYNPTWTTACVAGRCGIYNTSTGTYVYPSGSTYYYPYDYRYYYGASWVYCTDAWGNPYGWYLSGQQPYGAYCS